MDDVVETIDAGSGPADRLTNEQVYARIFDAIVDHKLRPGTHLKEDELCEIFRVGRTRIRSILARLSANHVVELVENRGAFVSRPTAEEACEVFRARRMIEGHLIRRVAENPTDTLRAALETHLAHEKAARDIGDQGAVIRRCSKFHLLLAEQAESPIVARFLRELTARSSLIVAVHEARPPDDCELDEHHELTELVLARRADDAVALMERHLRGIESRLDLASQQPPAHDLKAALQVTAGQPRD
ncbi:MAG: GntR family transcriptional regulator [Paracoccaceae bacterium]|nr:GntR family transcriptional regulator [Paracoccaceae bacterium]